MTFLVLNQIYYVFTPFMKVFPKDITHWELV